MDHTMQALHALAVAETASKKIAALHALEALWADRRDAAAACVPVVVAGLTHCVPGSDWTGYNEVAMRTLRAMQDYLVHIEVNAHLSTSLLAVLRTKNATLRRDALTFIARLAHTTTAPLGRDMVLVRELIGHVKETYPGTGPIPADARALLAVLRRSDLELLPDEATAAVHLLYDMLHSCAFKGDMEWAASVCAALANVVDGFDRDAADKVHLKYLMCEHRVYLAIHPTVLSNDMATRLIGALASKVSEDFIALTQFAGFIVTQHPKCGALSDRRRMTDALGVAFVLATCGVPYVDVLFSSGLLGAVMAAPQPGAQSDLQCDVICAVMKHANRARTRRFVEDGGIETACALLRKGALLPARLTALADALGAVFATDPAFVARGRAAGADEVFGAPEMFPHTVRAAIRAVYAAHFDPEARPKRARISTSR